MNARHLFLITQSVLFVLACSRRGEISLRKTEFQRKVGSPSTHVRPKRNATTSERCEALLPLLEKASKETGVELPLLVGVVRVESSFRTDARSSAGGRGLTQVIEATAKAYKCGDLDDPYQNILCGARVLKSLLDACDGDLILALSAYNAGLATIREVRAARSLPFNMLYVESVLWSRSRFMINGCKF